MLFYVSMLFSAKIISVSETTSSEIARVFPYFSSKTLTVRNGPSFDEEIYFDGESSAKSGRERPYVLAVGRIEERKNIPLLVRAFIRASISGVDLVIVGHRDSASPVDLPEHDEVHYLSGVGNAELIHLYRGADLFVFPSSAEGFGLPLLDAALFGKPCIASDQTSMPEVAGPAARLFDPTEVGAESRLAELIRAHFNADPIEALSLEQRREHFHKFNWSSGAKVLLQELGL